MFVVMFKDHGKLNCDQHVYGPFDNYDDAYDALCTVVPAFTQPEDAEQRNGWRFIQELEFVAGAIL